MIRPALLLAAAVTLTAPADAFTFVKGRLVVAVEGNGAGTGIVADNAAAPLTLYQFAHNGTASATYTDRLVLPQAANGKNAAISGEYGSSSEALLQRSVDGRSLVIAGYGINAAAFNANPTAYGTAVNDRPNRRGWGRRRAARARAIRRSPASSPASAPTARSTRRRRCMGSTTATIRAASPRPTAAASTSPARATRTRPAASSTRPAAPRRRPRSPGSTPAAGPGRRTRATSRSSAISSTSRSTARKAAATTATSSARSAPPARCRPAWLTAAPARRACPASATAAAPAS